MSGMTLQEQLARRLGYVYRLTHGWQEPEVHWGDRGTITETTYHNVWAEQAVWLKVADECIRQMEWAAANGFNHCCSRGLHNPLDPMTLAPEDWKP